MMQRKIVAVGLGLALVILALLALGRAQDTALAQVAPGDPGLVADIFNRTNQLRLSVGAAPLRFNDALARAAYDQAAYQVANGWWGHVRPDGSRPADRAALAGYTNAIRCCGENYYMSIDATPDLVWNFWVNSPDHYNNLTNVWYNDLGVAVATDGYRKSYIMVFGVGPAVVSAPSSFPFPTPTLVPAVSLPSLPTAPADTGTLMYTVQRGDTMLSIAQTYGVAVEDIARANNFANPNRITPGETLVIPGVAPLYLPAATAAPSLPTAVPTLAAVPVAAAGRTHVVAPGENLFRIALRYSTTVSALAAANGISDPTRIYVGQVLVIPGG